jgi:hypothetical protein
MAQTAVWETAHSGLPDRGILTKLQNTRPQSSSTMTPVEFEEFNILTLVSCGENKYNSLLILGISLIMLMGHAGYLTVS